MEVIAMVYIRNMNRYFAIGFILALLSGIMVFGLTHVASAQDRGSRQHEFMAPRSQHTPSFGAPRSQHIPSYSDSRYHHNRSIRFRSYVGGVPKRSLFSVSWVCTIPLLWRRMVLSVWFALCYCCSSVRSCRALFAFVLHDALDRRYTLLLCQRNILHANCGWLYGR